MPYPPLLSVIVDGRWRPGIGDPTFMGWLTVVAYFCSAAGCLRAAFQEPPLEGRPSAFWPVLAGLMVLLGINKQLDLQSLVTQVGRRVLEWAALDRDRRAFQAAFIGLVAVACLSGIAWLSWAANRSPRKRRLAAIGMAFILSFVVIRAASFHHVDILLASRLGGLKWNWILELGGILAVGASACLVRPGREGHAPGASEVPKNIFYYYKN
jgi:hypothetical protein